MPGTAPPELSVREAADPRYCQVFQVVARETSIHEARMANDAAEPTVLLQDCSRNLQTFLAEQRHLLVEREAAIARKRTRQRRFGGLVGLLSQSLRRANMWTIRPIVFQALLCLPPLQRDHRHCGQPIWRSTSSIVGSI